MARPALLLPALFGLGFGAGVALADPLQESEALAMLQKIADAARQLNYAGTFVYQHGDQVRNLAHRAFRGRQRRIREA